MLFINDTYRSHTIHYTRFLSLKWCRVVRDRAAYAAERVSLHYTIYFLCASVYCFSSQNRKKKQLFFSLLLFLISFAARL